MQYPNQHWMSPYWRTWYGSETTYHRSNSSYPINESSKGFYDYFDLEDPAPSFTLEAVVEGEPTDVSLSDYQGRWVILFFYGSDFTYV